MLLLFASAVRTPLLPLNDIPPFDERNTTAELLAEYVCQEVAGRLPAGREVRRVEIWETESSCAVYEP